MFVFWQGGILGLMGAAGGWFNLFMKSCARWMAGGWRAVLLAALLTGGCGSFRPVVQPVPGPGRDGGLYRYTTDYRDEYLPFALVGKALVHGDHSEGFNINCCAMGVAMFPGVPLYAVEQFVICPVVDTALIPYDLVLKAWEAHVCAKKGLKVSLADATGRPVAGCELAVTIDAKPGRRIVYDGRPCAPGYHATYVTTDGNGEAYVPIDMGTCGRVRLEGWAWVRGAKEDFSATVERDLYWGPEGLKRWGEIGERNRVVLRLKGKLSEKAEGERWPEGTYFAEGVEAGDFLRESKRSLGHELETQWATARVPDKAADFDAAWEADAAAMRGGWVGEVDVEEVAEASTGNVRFSRVAFEAGGRRIGGWLSEPAGDGEGGAAAGPVLAFFGRGRDPGPEELPKPADRTVLYLSAFEPGYDYGLGEWKVREKYGLQQGTVLEGYAIDGIDGGREAYFFHPVLSGALRAAEWLSERTGAESVRCVGSDQGGALALMTAALSPRVGGVDAYHPVFADVMSEAFLAWPQFRWHGRSGRMEEARRWMPYYEVCSFAGRVRCPVTLWANFGEAGGAGILTVYKALPEGEGKRLMLVGGWEAGGALGTLVAPEGAKAGARRGVPAAVPEAGADGKKRIQEWRVASFASANAHEAGEPAVPKGMIRVVAPTGKGRRAVRSGEGGAASVGVGMDPARAETVVWNGAGDILWEGRTPWRAPRPVRWPEGMRVWNGGEVAVPARPAVGVVAWNGADVAVRPKGWKKGAAVEVFAWPLEGYGTHLAQCAGEAFGCGTNAVCFEAEADGEWWVVRWDAWPDAPGEPLRFYVLAVKEDADGDGLADSRETAFWHSDSGNPDTDGDTRGDGLEVLLGANPIEPFMDSHLTVNALWSDPEGAGGSWVELYSSASRDFALEGFRLETAKEGEWRTVFAFPEGFSMRPGSTLLVGERGVEETDFQADLDLPAGWSSRPEAGVRVVWDGAERGGVADAVIVGRGHFPEGGGLDREGWESEAGVRPKGSEPIVRRYPGVDNNRSRDWTTREGAKGRSSKEVPDTDGDGLSDADEWSGRLNQPWGEPTNPLNPDSDGDGLSEREECCVYHTNPGTWTSDGDIYPWIPQGTPVREWPGSDPYEIEHGWNPLVADENENGIPDSWEMVFGTEALLGGSDKDGDGLSDLEELRSNRNPWPGGPVQKRP